MHSSRAQKKTNQKTNRVHHISRRTKVWKRKQDAIPEPHVPGEIKPRHLKYTLVERVAKRQNRTLQNIRPKVEFATKPTAENNWAFPKRRFPSDFQHRMLSYLDQFETPIRPKQVVKHFAQHPTNPVTTDMVYGMMRRLTHNHNMYKIRKVDEEGTEHWFVTSSPQSRVRHNRSLSTTIKLKRSLPIEEVVWEQFDESLSFANLREMTHEQEQHLHDVMHQQQQHH